MLPPVALLAINLFINVTGPACPNPCTAAPAQWVPNPISLALPAPIFSAPPAGPIANIAASPLPKAAAKTPPARIAARKPHVSVGDYTTQAQVRPAVFITPQETTDGDSQITLTADEAALLADLNLERSSRGLEALTPDANLTAIARAHSEDMCRRGYFDHIAPAPGPASPMDRYLASLNYRPDYAMVGENIYYRSLTDGIIQSATEANDAFMHSPGHRANILQPMYTKVGIGIYRDSQTGEFWVTEMFLRDTP